MKITEAKQTVKQLRQRIADLEQEAVRARLDREVLICDVAAIKDRLYEMEQEAIRVKIRLDALTVENSALKKQVKELEDEYCAKILILHARSDALDAISADLLSDHMDDEIDAQSRLDTAWNIIEKSRLSRIYARLLQLEDTRSDLAAAVAATLPTNDDFA